MTSEQHEERRAWWAIQSEKRALAQRIAEGSISYAHRVEVEEQIRFAEESYRDGLAAMESAHPTHCRNCATLLKGRTYCWYCQASNGGSR